MSDFSPEQQKAYDEEMKRLEAGTKVETKVETKETITSDDTVEQLRSRLDKQEKALKDTQRWAHQAAGDAAKLRREAEERERLEREARVKPLFDANPVLEEGIKHVAQGQERYRMEILEASVRKAIPDVDDLLNDPVFHAKASARREELGQVMEDPLIAIRELSELKASHMSERATKQAVEAARKDFEEKAKKRSAMEVPGGSGSKATTEVPDDDAKKWRDMPTNDFRKERAKVMGHQG